MTEIHFYLHHFYYSAAISMSYLTPVHIQGRAAEKAMSKDMENKILCSPVLVTSVVGEP